MRAQKASLYLSQVSYQILTSVLECINFIHAQILCMLKVFSNTEHQSDCHHTRESKNRFEGDRGPETEQRTQPQVPKASLPRVRLLDAHFIWCLWYFSYDLHGGSIFFKQNKSVTQMMT